MELSSLFGMLKFSMRKLDQTEVSCRVAGNVVDDSVLGTIEYGLDHLHTPLLVVMGHTSVSVQKCFGLALAINASTLVWRGQSCDI